jgi:hypothetical protein
LTLNLHNEPEWIFPFEQMERGESFFIPTVKTSNMIYAVETRAKAIKIKVKVFVTTKEGHLGVRVWRIS